MRNRHAVRDDHITTEDLLVITKVTRDTLYKWVAIRLLAKPRILTDSYGHQFAAWSSDSLARVRFVVAKRREGLSLDDVVALISHVQRRS
jgi:DNA-binding transcriptional MerR regulator